MRLQRSKLIRLIKEELALALEQSGGAAGVEEKEKVAVA